jgi:biofilm PGA synthesis N-glycosyltransferase PgaC
MADRADHRVTVSLCILCYNQADEIGATIQSALAQTRPADEILVVDDGSTDGSRDRIRAFPGVRLLEHPTNQGRPAARRTLLHAATSDIVAYLDGDTVAEPDLLEHLLTEYAASDVGGVGGRGVETNLRTAYDRWRARHAVQQWASRQESAEFLFGLCFSFRRRLIHEAGGFQGVGEDVDLSHRVRALGYRLVYTPLARVQHRRTDDRASLLHMIRRWWYGGYLAYARNGRPAMRIQLGRLIRDVVVHTYQDFCLDRDIELATIDFLVVPTKLRAIMAARATHRSRAP